MKTAQQISSKVLEKIAKKMSKDEFVRVRMNSIPAGRSIIQPGETAQVGMQFNEDMLTNAIMRVIDERLRNERKGKSFRKISEARGAALAASPEGQQIIFNLLKQASDRLYKRALDENPEVAQATQQRKDDLHNQELQFGQDKHKFELQKLQLQVEQQQMDNEAKKQKLMQSGMMPPTPQSPAQQQGQYLSNLMTSQPQ